MQQYYYKTDKTSVDNMEKSLIANGFNVSVNKVKCSLTRETNQYNKYMKWHLVTKAENGSIASEWFKSKPAAFRHLEKPSRPCPIGDFMSISYIEMED